MLLRASNQIKLCHTTNGMKLIKIERICPEKIQGTPKFIVGSFFCTLRCFTTQEKTIPFGFHPGTQALLSLTITWGYINMVYSGAITNSIVWSACFWEIS